MRKGCFAALGATGLVAFATAAWAAPPLLFLDRCAGDCSYTPGVDDSRTNATSILGGSATLTAFAHGDASFDAVVACVRDAFAPFAIEVTDVDPGGTDHFEVAVAGNAQQFTLPAGITNVSPVSCANGGVIANGVAFAFANAIGDAPLEICWNAAQAAGSLLGLDREVLTGDVMTSLQSSLPKAFLDETAQCGETQPRECFCGGTTQNSYQRLLAALPEAGANAAGLVALGGLGLLARGRPSRRRSASTKPSP